MLAGVMVIGLHSSVKYFNIKLEIISLKGAGPVEQEHCYVEMGKGKKKHNTDTKLEGLL